MTAAENRSHLMAEIADERQRQKSSEHWTEAHDDGHRDGELAIAAACYATCENEDATEPRMWPWDSCWWKPKNRRRNLIRAAALIVAEIERLDRTGAAQ